MWLTMEATHFLGIMSRDKMQLTTEATHQLECQGKAS